jgi:hypothetical protein
MRPKGIGRISSANGYGLNEFDPAKDGRMNSTLQKMVE